MKAMLEKAWGYQGDKMNLPVRDLAAALPFYETVLGFQVLSRSDTPSNWPCLPVTRSRSDSGKRTAAIPRQGRQVGRCGKAPGSPAQFRRKAGPPQDPAPEDSSCRPGSPTLSQALPSLHFPFLDALFSSALTHAVKPPNAHVHLPAADRLGIEDAPFRPLVLCLCDLKADVIWSRDKSSSH